MQPTAHSSRRRTGAPPRQWAPPYLRPRFRRRQPRCQLLLLRVRRRQPQPQRLDLLCLPPLPCLPRAQRRQLRTELLDFLRLRRRAQVGANLSKAAACSCGRAPRKPPPPQPPCYHPPTELQQQQRRRPHTCLPLDQPVAVALLLRQRAKGWRRRSWSALPLPSATSRRLVCRCRSPDPRQGGASWAARARGRPRRAPVSEPPARPSAGAPPPAPGPAPRSRSWRLRRGWAAVLTEMLDQFFDFRGDECSGRRRPLRW